MSKVVVNDGNRPYVAFYAGRRVEVYAINALCARDAVAEQLKVPPKKRHLITVLLADVPHNTASI